MWWQSIPIVGKVIDGTFNLIDKSIEDKDEAIKIKATLEKVYRDSDLTKFSQQIKSQTNIIIAEATGQSWLQRNWRPCLMVLFGIIIANNYILNPWLAALFGIDIIMQIPPDMWKLLSLGVGGYIVGRSGEKIIDKLKK